FLVLINHDLFNDRLAAPLKFYNIHPCLNSISQVYRQGFTQATDRKLAEEHPVTTGIYYCNLAITWLVAAPVFKFQMHDRLRTGHRIGINTEVFFIQRFCIYIYWVKCLRSAVKVGLRDPVVVRT